MPAFETDLLERLHGLHAYVVEQHRLEIEAVQKLDPRSIGDFGGVASKLEDLDINVLDQELELPDAVLVEASPTIPCRPRRDASATKAADDVVLSRECINGDLAAKEGNHVAENGHHVENLAIEKHVENGCKTMLRKPSFDDNCGKARSSVASARSSVASVDSLPMLAVEESDRNSQRSLVSTKIVPKNPTSMRNAEALTMKNAGAVSSTKVPGATLLAKAPTMNFGAGFKVKDAWNNGAIANESITQVFSDATWASSMVVAPVSGDSFSLSHPEKSKKEKPFRCPMFHPTSTFRQAWTFLSILFLTYDSVMVPVDSCFTFESPKVLEIFQFIARWFWTFDILVSFRTGILLDGRLVMEFWKVAWEYGKTWMAFDVIVVGTEWTLEGFGEVGGTSLSASSSELRSLPILRVLRFVRFARLAKLKPLLQQLVLVSSQGLVAIMRLLTAALLIIYVAHISACLWHLLGDKLDNGWVSATVVGSNSVGRKYMLSLHWVILRLHGCSSGIVVMRTTPEIVVDCMLTLCSLALDSYFIATFVETVRAWAHSDAAQLQELAVGFTRRHNISNETSQKLRRFLQKERTQGADAFFEQESRLLKALPRVLQEELSYASHMPLLAALQHFRDSNAINTRFIRHLCVEALSDVVASQGDDVFVEGDACSRVLFMLSGRLRYYCDEATLANTPREIPRSKSMSGHGVDEVSHGNVLSEPVLWTYWEYHGKLTSVEDSGLIALATQKFEAAVSQHHITNVYATKYARYFVYNLNRVEYCDLTGFGLTLEDLEDNTFAVDQEAHLAFISHYKVEAGTEATLMRDLLDRAVQADPGNCSLDEYGSAFFVDSEDLEDLARLKLHVEGSEFLILLLTPGLLSRPWCLLEIVTAMKSDVHLVPVEIQRPGMQYKYPDEEFYEKFRDFRIISKEDFHLLADEGCTMAELEEAIRNIFKKIALPFSPHKSNNVRHAEILDILRRLTNGRLSVQRPSGADRPSGTNVGRTTSVQRPSGADR